MSKSLDVVNETVLNKESIKPKKTVKKFFIKLFRSKTGTIGLFIMLLAVVTAIFAPIIAPFDPNKIDSTAMLSPPAWIEGGSMDHILGTDHLGRDIFSRIIYGTRISLLVGVFSVVVAGALGVTFGLIAGYYGGIWDHVFMRLADAFLAIPSILFALVFLTVLNPGVTSLIVVLGITNWVLYARLVRGDTLSIREREYVKAARSMGVKDSVIIRRHILPNVFSAIIIVSTLSVATTIIAESSLSFLGLGIQPPSITWGIMLSEGRDYIATSWWLSTFPGVAITITVLGIIFFGEWLRDILDPKN